MEFYELYNKLINNLNNYEKKLIHKFKKNINCKKGCSKCCILKTVFPVEAYFIHNFISTLDEILKKEILTNLKNKKDNCVFLKNDLCLIYIVRPVICRTHGYPILIENNIDFCPKNFNLVKSFDSEYIINLENINNLLVIINKLFIGSDENFFGKTHDRISLNDLIKP